MKQRQLQTILFSTVGVILMAVILIGVNAIVSSVHVRADVTEGGLYTLSSGTKEILKELKKKETPIEIRYYATQSPEIMPPNLATYADHVEDFLNQYKRFAGNSVRIKKFNPKPDSDAADSASMDGIQGQQLRTGQKVYLGLVVSMVNREKVIPFLNPNEEAMLEYDISRAVANVMEKDKPTVAVFSGLPVFGSSPQNPMMRMRQQQQQQDPWLLIKELRKDFEVRELSSGFGEIGSDVDVVLLLHPKGLSKQDQYAIDQYLMNGGKMMAMVDPMSLMDQGSGRSRNPLQRMQRGASTLGELMPAWGYQFNTNKVVADRAFSTRVSRSNRQQRSPAVLSITKEGINDEDVLTAHIDQVLMPFAGAIEGEPKEGLSETVLLHSTEDSQLMEKMKAQFSGRQQGMTDFEASGNQYKLALRLTGNFKTAFPDGKPASENGSGQSGDGAAGESGNGQSGPSGPHLSESDGSGVVVLAGDTDFVADRFAANIQRLFGQEMVQLRGGNLPLAQSAVEQLAGNDALIAVRSRATMTRPFTKIREMEEKAQKRYKEELSEVQKSLEEVRNSLSKLRSVQQSGSEGQTILSEEQQQKIQQFKEQRAKLSQRQEDLRRQLRADINALQNRLKWINIAGMPALVTILGLIIAIVKKKRTAAK